MMAGGDSEAPAPSPSPIFWNLSSSLNNYASLQATSGPPAGGISGDTASGREKVKETSSVLRTSGRRSGKIPLTSSRLTCSEQAFVPNQRIDACSTAPKCTIKAVGPTDATTSASPIREDTRERHSRMNALPVDTSGRAAAAALINRRAPAEVEGSYRCLRNKGTVIIRAVRRVLGKHRLEITPDFHFFTLPQNSSTPSSADQPTSASGLVSTPNRPATRSSRYPVVSNGAASSHVPQYNALIHTSIVVDKANEVSTPVEQRRLQELRSPCAHKSLQPPRQAQPQQLCTYSLIKPRHTISAAFREVSLRAFYVGMQSRHLIGTSVGHTDEKKGLRGEKQLKRDQNGHCIPGSSASDTSKSEQRSKPDIPVSRNALGLFLKYWRQARHGPFALLSLLLYASVLLFFGFLCASSFNKTHPYPSSCHSGRRQPDTIVKNHFLNDVFCHESFSPHQNVSVILRLTSEPAESALPRTAHRTPGDATSLAYEFYHSYRKTSKVEAAAHKRSSGESSDRDLEDKAAAGVTESTHLRLHRVHRRAYPALGRHPSSGAVHASDDADEGIGTRLRRQTLFRSSTQPFDVCFPSVPCSRSTRQASHCESSEASGRSPAPVALIDGLAARKIVEAAERHQLRLWEPSAHQESHNGFSTRFSCAPLKASGFLFCQTDAATDSNEVRRLSSGKGNQPDRGSATEQKGPSDFVHKDHSIEAQSLKEETEEEEQQQRRGCRRVELQHQQGAVHRCDEHGLGESLDGDTTSGPAQLRVSGANDPVLPKEPISTTSSKTLLTSKTVQVVGGATVRRLHASLEEDDGGEQEPSGASDAAGLLGEAAESTVAKDHVKAGPSVSAAGRKAAPPATPAEHNRTRSKGKVASIHNGKSGSLLSKPQKRQEPPPSEERSLLATRTMRQVVQKAILALNETKEGSRMTQQRQQAPKEQEIADRRRVSSIPALRKLLTELSVASRKRREEAAERGHASVGEKAIAVPLSVHTPTTPSPPNSTIFSPLTSTDDEAVVSFTRKFTRIPRTVVEAADFPGPTMGLIAAPQTRSASEIGEGSRKVEIVGTETVTGTRENDYSEDQPWDMESAEELEETPAQQDGDDTNEGEQTEFIQQQEEEASRRAKMRHRSSVVPGLSTNFTDVHETSQASHTNEVKGLTSAVAVKGTVAESVESGVMKQMWKTREQLSDLAKKKLRTFNNSATRRQVCNIMQSDQLQYRLWFTLASLFVIEWPFYSYSEGGGLHFLGELLEQTKAFAAPPGSSRAVQQRYETFRACRMPAALEEGLLTLMDCLPSGAQLPAVLNAAAEQPAFAKLLHALGDVHVPLDNYHGLAHIFDIVEAAMGLAWGKNAFLGKTGNLRPSFKPFTAEELYDKYTYSFSESRRYFSTMLLLFRAMRQHVTQKPHTGIVLLLVEQPETPHSKTVPFNRLQDFRVLKAQIHESVRMKLESALTRFHPSGRRSSSKEMVDLPDIRVSGFFARNGDDRTVEKGLVGVEIDFALMERFKQETPKFGVMIQVNLLDTWAEKNSPEAWPDVLEPYNTVLSAYTATQLLKTELLWDPSLASLAWGRTKFVYSSISEVFEYEKVRDSSSHGSAPAYDPDLHVMLLQSYKDFVMQGREEGVMKHLIDSLKRKPLGHARIPRTFDADRITFQGSAMLLSQAPVRTTEDAEKESASHLSETGTASSSVSPASTSLRTPSALRSAPAGRRAGKEFPLQTVPGRPVIPDMAELPGTGARHLQAGDMTPAPASRQRGKTATQGGGISESKETDETAGTGKLWESRRTKGWRSADAGVDDVGGGSMRTVENRQLYRKKQFGAGLNYGEVLLLEKAIRKNTIMLHIKIKGLANAAAEEWQSLQAHEILNRLAQRLRGAFEIHYVEAIKPRPKPTESSRPVSRKGYVPDWILALSVCATAAFFMCCIVLLVHHNNLKVPWWLSCFYSRLPPWEKDTTAHSASRPPSTSDDENGSVSWLRTPVPSGIRGRSENLSVISENHSTQEEASPVKATVAALSAVPRKVSPVRGVGRSMQLIRPRHVTPSFQEKHRMRWRRPPLSSGKKAVCTRPGRSVEAADTGDSMAASACPSDGSNPFDSVGVGARITLGPAGSRAQNSGSFSYTLPDEMGGSDSNGQGTTRKFGAASRGEAFIPAPRLLSQRLPDTKSDNRQQQHESQQQHSKGQHLRQQAELEATILAARWVTRVTRASRIVLENSWCPPPVSSK